MKGSFKPKGFESQRWRTTALGYVQPLESSATLCFWGRLKRLRYAMWPGEKICTLIQIFCKQTFCGGGVGDGGGGETGFLYVALTDLELTLDLTGPELRYPSALANFPSTGIKGLHLTTWPFFPTYTHFLFHSCLLAPDVWQAVLQHYSYRRWCSSHSLRTQPHKTGGPHFRVLCLCF